jgi:predicted RNA-binding Zn-ribbon protein involved in translation (DUF1610 family)
MYADRIDPDACPNCGATVEAHGAHGVGARREGQKLPEAREQTQQCPQCGKYLRRAVGASWALDTTRS